MVMNPEIDRQTLVIQRNNEAVSLLQRGEYTEAKSRLMDALQDFRSDMAECSCCLGDYSSQEDSSFQSLSLDQWMDPSIESVATDDGVNRSFFVYPKGVQIPANYFSDSRYCPVDVTAAIASVIFFNQGLSCHLAYLQAPSQCIDDESLQKASELYRLSLKSMRHIKFRMPPLQSSNNHTSTTNATFMTAAMNNLAVSERMLAAGTDESFSSTTATTPTTTPPRACNEYFETLRRFLLNWRPRNSAEEVLWNCFIENVLRSCRLLRSDYCASPA